MTVNEFSGKKLDKRNEQAVTEFLRRNVHPFITNFTTYDDKEHQLKGIDATGDIPSKGIINAAIDLKALMHYRNRSISTLGFEVFGVMNGKQTQKGWLFDESQEVQYYVCTDIFSTYYQKSPSNEEIDPVDELTPDTIWGLHIMLVDKAKLLKYLRDNAIIKSTAQAKAQLLFNSGKECLVTTGISDVILPIADWSKYSRQHSVPFSFRRNLTMKEQPVTIMVKRDILREYGIFTLEGSIGFKK
jgi:hypothetical protein